jgi:riboflavin synthase
MTFAADGEGFTKRERSFAMFTGLVEDCGTVVALAALPQNSGRRLRLASPLLAEVMALGASLAVDGVCLTVVTARPGEVELEAGPETLARTTLGGLAVGDTVHLERALRLGDRLGGHLVAGHVDGVGKVAATGPRGDNWDVTVACPAELLRYVVEKGAITIDGVSLTVNQVDAAGFSVSLVPYTQAKIRLHKKRVGAGVNLEVDLIGKYVEKLLAPYAAPKGEGLSLQKLKENGFV